MGEIYFYSLLIFQSDPTEAAAALRSSVTPSTIYAISLSDEDSNRAELIAISGEESRAFSGPSATDDLIAAIGAFATCTQIPTQAPTEAPVETDAPVVVTDVSYLLWSKKI